MEIVNQKGSAVSLLNYYGISSIDQRFRESDLEYLHTF